MSESLEIALAQLVKGDPPPESAGVFGSPHSAADAELIILGVPWDATSSYSRGSHLTPNAIIQPSHQLDLFDPFWGSPILKGVFLHSLGSEVEGFNQIAVRAADDVMKRVAAGEAILSDDPSLSKVQNLSRLVTARVTELSETYLEAGKTVAVLGGDHSCPLGLMQSLGRRYGEFGILHVDAHLDLRVAYEGFAESHASIMDNALKTIPSLTKLVSLGVRDFCIQEHQYATQDVIKFATWNEIELSLMTGTFIETMQNAVNALPQHVYLSFDIDGLDPALCPGTGTPVPGGFSFAQISLLLHMIAKSGKKIIGFDLCEVAPNGSDDDWDYNVGARVLYQLVGAWSFSNYGFVDTSFRSTI